MQIPNDQDMLICSNTSSGLPVWRANNMNGGWAQDNRNWVKEVKDIINLNDIFQELFADYHNYSILGCLDAIVDDLISLSDLPGLG